MTQEKQRMSLLSKKANTLSKVTTKNTPKRKNAQRRYFKEIQNPITRGEGL